MSSDEKQGKLLAIGVIVLIFVGVYTLKKYTASEDAIDKDSKEILDDASDFEKMEAEIRNQGDQEPKDLAETIIQRSQKKTTETTKTTEEKTETVITGSGSGKFSCTNIEKALNKCKGEKGEDAPSRPEGGAKEVDSKGSRASSSSFSQQSNSASGKRLEASDASNEPKLSKDAEALLAWKGLNSSKIETIDGRQKKHSGKVLKAGCELLAVVQNEVHVIPGLKHVMKLNVRGPLDNCILPKTEGIQLIAEATMTDNDRGVLAVVKTCTDRNPLSKSVDCIKSEGHVLSITGSQILEGDLYDETGMGIFWETILSLGMTAPLAQLTETAASAKTIFNSASASQIAATLTETTDRISQKIAGIFNAKGIRLKPEDGRPIPVIVMFEKDVVLN